MASVAAPGSSSMTLDTSTGNPTGEGQPRVIGVDLSLASTGVAGPGWTARIQPPRTVRNAHERDRRRWIRDQVLDYTRGADLVVMEGLALSSRTGQALTRAGLWCQIDDAIDHRGTPIAVVPPTVRAKYATGKGNAGKDAVLAAVIKRYPTIDVDGNDEADALALCAMGLDWLGHPLVRMPQTHRAALDGATWPSLVTD